jgi:hypothetical protein
MKNRARIVSGLAALAALFLAPIADASITRSSTPPREAPALALSLAAPESFEFSLFEGTELALAAAESGGAESFHPLAAVSLLSKNGAEAPLVSVDELSYPKTRYRVFDFLGTTLVGVEHGVTLELHWGCASFSCGLASGTVGWLSQDPMGDKDSPNLYGFVRMRPHELTDPLGLLGIEDAPGIVGDTLMGMLDPRNAWTNAQRAAGGVVGAGRFVGKTAVGVGSLVVDAATMSVSDAAADRMVARGQGIAGAISHPIDAVVNAHSDAFNKILSHEQKGEYFSSGVEAGETGVADAAAITGAYGAARGAVGAVSRAASFSGLTEAAGAGIADYSAEVARAARVTPRSVVPAQLPAGVVWETEQLAAAGRNKHTRVWRPDEADIQSTLFKAIVGDAKYTRGGQPVGTIFDAADGDFLELKGGTSVLDSTYQLRIQTYRALRAGKPYTIRTSRPIGSRFQETLDFWGVTVEAPK